MSRCIKLELGFPPTVNHVYGQRGNRRFIKKEGVAFIEKVKEIVALNFIGDPLQDALKFEMWVYMPDKRKRDLDNLLKISQDSLQKSGVYFNDCQISELHVYKLPEIVKGGKIFVRVEELK